MRQITIALSALLLSLPASVAQASQCTPIWSFGLPDSLYEQDTLQRLGPELPPKLRQFEIKAQWNMIEWGAHIIIEATPGQIVLLKKRPMTTPRWVITFRDVVWLRDLRRGARRPKTVALAVRAAQEVDDSRNARARVVPYDSGLSLLPANPKRRYIFLLRLLPPKDLASFDNALTPRPIASLDDPTNGCTDAFTIELQPLTPTEADIQKMIYWTDTPRLMAYGLKQLQRLRDRPDLH